MARWRSGKRAGEAGVTPNGATVGHEAELDAAIAENPKALGFRGLQNESAPDGEGS